MPEPTSPPPRPGTLRSLVGGFVALTLTRAELFGLEALEQKEQLLRNTLIGMTALVCLLIGLMAALLFVVLLTPPAWRVTLLGLLTALFAALGLGALRQLQRRLRRQSAPFATSLAEVRKDWETLSGRDKP
ncbi:phage holin family protein [Vogesella sp. GCM10023246]|uniref:Phage holin family protein n=1 Tax=Vogesella oryzagri TaxID=3160864 RepID=A0ABV1M2T2_9NEIS